MPSNQGYQKVATDRAPDEEEDLEIDMKNKTSTNPSGGGGLPSTHSSQQLVTDTESVTTSLDDTAARPVAYTTLRSISAKHWFTVGVLCFVNLINYMDRFTIAGILTEIQTDFNVGNDKGGLLQTAFILSYMVCAPLFGYLGDRYSRRWIMIVGVALWCATTLLGSFMNGFGWFIAFRSLVGVGEASYSTIAPTIISDLFVNSIRSKMLAMFYFAIPVGSGLGYIIGSETAAFAGDWRWALRVTPILGVAAVILIYLTEDPERGESEGSHGLEVTSYTQDLKAICKNRSFMLSTAGFTCVAFVAGALSWWGPSFIHIGMKMQPGNENLSINEVAFIFGALTMVSGILGVPLGSFISQKLIGRYPRIDPLVCGCGLFLSAPFLLAALYLVSTNSAGTYVCIFLCELFLNLNWAIVADILLYVVIPTRRSTAEAFQILISHTFGDAGSPYLVGVISEALKAYFRKSKDITTKLIQENENIISTTVSTLNSTLVADSKSKDPPEIEFKSLQYALFTTCFVEVFGALFFFITAYYIIRDKRKAEKIVQESQAQPQHEYADSPTR